MIRTAGETYNFISKKQNRKGIQIEKEIFLPKRVNTKKFYNRKKFVKKQSRRLFNKIIPLKGGDNLF